jgi:hypothetical protein
MTRMRYVVETPDDHPGYALDTVVCNEATEVSQKFLEEVIVSHREISKKKYLKMFNEDNAYLRNFTDDEKLGFVTSVKK